MARPACLKTKFATDVADVVIVGRILGDPRQRQGRRRSDDEPAMLAVNLPLDLGHPLGPGPGAVEEAELGRTPGRRRLGDKAPWESRGGPSSRPPTG